MQLDDLVIGRSYAFRDRPRARTSLLKVTLIEKTDRPGKVRIRFDDGPHRCLHDFINTRQLIVPWGQRRRLLRDEERGTQLKAYATPLADKALATAVKAVLEASGESALCVREDVSTLGTGELERLCDRAGVNPAPAELHPLAFEDRNGTVHVPLDGLIKLAQAFAAAEPATVLGYLDDQEEELTARGNAPGERWCHDYQRQLAPGVALALRWAGVANEVQRLGRETARLRAIVSSAASDLRIAGATQAAGRLLRALDGR